MNDSYVDLIRQANPTRSMNSYIRRKLKLGEELGEVMEAYLNITSSFNGKHKTWDDVREELVDVAIVATDIALTTDPNFSLYDAINQRNGGYAINDENMLLLLRMDVVDCLCTTLSMLENIPGSDFDTNINKFWDEVSRKLAKWDANRKKMVTVVDDV